MRVVINITTRMIICVTTASGSLPVLTLDR